MKALKVSLIASLIGTAVGFGSWIFGLGRIIWPSDVQLSVDPRHDHRDPDYLATDQ